MCSLTRTYCTTHNLSVEGGSEPMHSHLRPSSSLGVCWKFACESVCVTEREREREREREIREREIREGAT